MMTREELQQEVFEYLRSEMTLHIKVIRPGYGQSPYARFSIEIEGREIDSATLDLDESSEP